jgi:predicted PurR-regulated permease PerM
MSEVPAQRNELARTTLAVLFVGGLIVGSLWVLGPFLAAFIWATTLVVATWPLLLRAQRACGGRRGPAVAIMVSGLLVALIVPMVVAVDAILSNVDDLAGFAAALARRGLPPAPEWIAGLPLVGERIAAGWGELASAPTAELQARLQPHLRAVAAWLAQHAGGFAMLLVQFLLVAVFAAVLYARGEVWANWILRFGRRLAPQQGDRIVMLAGGAIRGVAMGVVITALLQSILGGVGLFVAGVPFAAVLTAVMFLLCLAQLGPILVLLAGTAWVFHAAGALWGGLMLVFSLAVGLMDNVVRPLLIRRGADLPLLLIFTGVVGGLVAFGLIGIFVGPVILAVAYTLLDSWVAENPVATPAGATSAQVSRGSLE